MHKYNREDYIEILILTGTGIKKYWLLYARFLLPHPVTASVIYSLFLYIFYINVHLKLHIIHNFYAETIIP